MPMKSAATTREGKNYFREMNMDKEKKKKIVAIMITAIISLVASITACLTEAPSEKNTEIDTGCHDVSDQM